MARLAVLSGRDIADIVNGATAIALSIRQARKSKAPQGGSMPASLVEWTEPAAPIVMAKRIDRVGPGRMVDVTEHNNLTIDGLSGMAGGALVYPRYRRRFGIAGYIAPSSSSRPGMRHKGGQQYRPS